MRTYHTSSKAGKIAKMPHSLVTITHPDYMNALTFNADKSNNNRNAYLQPVKPITDVPGCDIGMLELRIDNNIVYLGDYPATEYDFRDLGTDRAVDDINIQMLAAVYSVLYRNINIDDNPDDNGLKNYSVDVYIPDFMEFVAGSRNFNQKQKQAVINRLAEFHNLVGVLKKYDGYETREDRYVVLVINNIKESTNTINISSPYMSELIRILANEKRISNTGNKKGVSKEKPNYSVLIKGTIATARSSRAAEIVRVIIILIEQCGRNRIPRAKVQTIIDRCPSIKAALESYSTNSDRNKLLKRTFSAAWDYLARYTWLFKNKIPEVTKYIPTVNDMDVIMYFILNGRYKSDEKAEIIISPKYPNT